MEPKLELATKLKQSTCRRGNMLPPEEVLTLYIDALHPTIRSVVARYRESHRRATYLDIVYFADQYYKNQVVSCTRKRSREPNRFSHWHLLFLLFLYVFWCCFEAKALQLYLRANLVLGWTRIVSVPSLSLKSTSITVISIVSALTAKYFDFDLFLDCNSSEIWNRGASLNGKGTCTESSISSPPW